MRSNVNLIRFAWRYWYIFLVVVLASGLLAAVFSGPKFISPKYDSEAVIYPANLGVYSGETRLEQMQQYLESNAIRDTIIQKFDLYEEYELDPEYHEAKSLMLYFYSEHIGFEETRFESIRIKARSTDPVKARDIVAEIIDQLNHTIRETERAKYAENIEMFEEVTVNLKAQIDSLENEIAEISTKYNIIDLSSQSERVTEGYLQFLLQGKKGEGFEETKNIYINLEKYGKTLDRMHLELEELTEAYAEMLTELNEARRNYNKQITYSNVLVSPEVSDKKAYPIRWLIVVSAMVAASMFTFIVLTFVKYSPRKQ
jgi:capsule polysaccharide export protein KpsE/RkpR